jgi:hypothetical protein
MTKLEELLEWMDDADYAPSYGELREKVKELIEKEQQVKSVDLADVGGSLPTCTLLDREDVMFGKYKLTSCCKQGPVTDENYCPHCGTKILKQ